jgi:hypothetical protein
MGSATSLKSTRRSAWLLLWARENIASLRLICAFSVDRR